jgi:hypothetical protein
MGGIYDVHRPDGLRYHDVNKKSLKDWFKHLKVHGGGDSQTHSSMAISKPYFSCISKKKGGKKERK